MIVFENITVNSIIVENYKVLTILYISFYLTCLVPTILILIYFSPNKYRMHKETLSLFLKNLKLFYIFEQRLIFTSCTDPSVPVWQVIITPQFYTSGGE